MDIIEIMPNCNANNQGHIYTSILQGFSNTLITEVYSDSYATKKRACMDRKTRKLFKIYGGLHPKSDIDKLHIPRKDGGRGLIAIQECRVGS